ncbi:MAG: hypothetical protein COU68_00705, partial [Candidatus Pacebacteria bacterium CG10_big_fil_rev_8_21_14_0_10_45_6]
MDITMVDKCEYVIGSTGCLNCNKVFFSFDCDGCHSVWLSKDLTNCSDCFGCAGLRNMKYCLFNEQLTKDEYERRLAEINTGSYMQFQEMAERAKNTWLSVPNRYMHGRHNDVVSGEYINNSKNVRDSYIVFEGQDCRYCMWLVIKPNKDCYDYTQFGENAQSMYETLTTGKGVSNIRFSNFCTSEVSRLTYCDACHNGSADLFACIGMRKKQYCIFNKKYTKEQYEELVPKIITQMNELPFIDKKGREYKFGEYLPIELSPFAYNETDAQEYYPMTKAAVIDAGYKWFEIEEKKHQETIMWSALPDEIGGVSDAITKQIILCKTWAEDSVHAQEQLCTKVYRILPQEL